MFVASEYRIDHIPGISDGYDVKAIRDALVAEGCIRFLFFVDIFGS